MSLESEERAAGGQKGVPDLVLPSLLHVYMTDEAGKLKILPSWEGRYLASHDFQLKGSAIAQHIYS